MDMISSIADLSKTIVNKIFPDKLSDGEKLQAQVALEQILSERENTLVNAQRDIITAELQQEDKYTKRMRPTLGYAGLLFILCNYVAVPIVSYFMGSSTLPKFELPEEFWWAWGSYCGIYALGRSYEKTNGSNIVTTAITGKK